MSALKSLVATGTKLWLDSIDPDLVRANRAEGATGATSNPVIIGDIWFGDGPYKSRADAKLARSTIRVCPALTPDEEKDEDGTN